VTLICVALEEHLVTYLLHLRGLRDSSVLATILIVIDVEIGLTYLLHMDYGLQKRLYVDLCFLQRITRPPAARYRAQALSFPFGWRLGVVAIASFVA